MIDLKTILQQYPDCINSRSSFKSVLMDICPSQKRVINILTIMFENGIIQKLKNKPLLHENEFQAILLQLETDYGITSQYSDNCLKILADALGVKVQTVDRQPSHSIKQMPNIGRSFTDVVSPKGYQSDYEVEVLESGALKIVKFIGFDEDEIIIPNQLDGKSVTVVGENAFAKCAGIKKVIIPEGIIAIESGAFAGCRSLATISLPTTLKHLGNMSSAVTSNYSFHVPGVFEGTAIRSIDLPKDLSTLGKSTFQSCLNLTHIVLPNSVSDIPENCFYGCSVLESIVLPENLTVIHARAFSCTGLKQIDIPAPCYELGRSSFAGCIHLSHVQLHEGLIKINNNVFENCISLHAITIPDSVTEIGESIFKITESYPQRRANDLTISCYTGSSGLKYARKAGYQVNNAAK